MLKYRGYPLRLFPMHIEEILCGASQLVAGRREWAMQQADQYIKNFLERDMTQFKVGDKVKCIKPKSEVHPDYDLCGNTVYVVSKFQESFSGKPAMHLEGGPFGYKQDRFELVKEGHPHAILMARYAEVAKDNPEPWQFFQYHNRRTGKWVNLRQSPFWNPDIAYREKPKEVTASMWVAYVTFTDAPEILHAITAHSKVGLEEALAVNVRDSKCRVVKDVHEVTETYEVL